MPQDDETKRAAAYYDEFSGRYDRERGSGYFGFINDLEFDKIRPLAHNKRVLEIGCGTGLILERTHEIAEEAVGVDISPGMIEECRRKGLNTRLINVSELPFEDDSFDLVYAFKVLPHIPDIRAVLSEAVRVTRPDGRMVFEFYNVWSFKALNDWIKARVRRQPVYLRHDSLPKFLSHLPDSVEVASTRGIRIFGSAAFFYTVPVLGHLTRWLDKKTCESGLLCRFGGYFVVELKFNGERK